MPNHAVCRGDKVDRDSFHCSTPLREECSTTVFVNGTGVSRRLDKNHPHLIPGPFGCFNHRAAIAVGSTTVFANGFGVGRIGDVIGGCTAVASGSNNVFAGG